MSFDPGDVVLNAYLDDRLDPPERAAFEVRIARDPALAARVERYREFRRALRGDGEEPSPAFYTRVRAEFEAQTRRGWLRLVSWEAVGLAAAAALIAVVFLPGFVRRDEFFSPLNEQPLSAPLRDSPADAAPPATSAPAPQSGSTGPRNEAAAETQLEKKEEAEADQLRRANAPREDMAPTEDDGGGRGRDEFAPVPPAPEPQPAAPVPPSAPPPAPRSREADSAAREQSEAAGRYGVTSQSAGAREKSSIGSTSPYAEPVRIAIPLHGTSLGRGEVRTLETQDAWAEARSALPQSDLPPPIEGHVLVLIGPRDRPVSCNSATIVPRRGMRVIELHAPAEGEEAAAAGCAVVVPLAGDPIGVVGPGEPR